MRCIRARGKNIASSELLWEYHFLKLLWSNCSPAESAVRRLDSAQHLCVDLLGEECIDLPRHTCSQMEEWLRRCRTARSSNPTQLKHCWQVYAMCTFVWFLEASETRNAISTVKKGKSEAGLTQGTKPVWNRLQEALERLAFVVNLMQKTLEL